MYPSLNNFNDNFHSTIPQEPYHAPSFSSFLHPYPGYIPLEDEAVFCEFFQQQEFFSKDHNRNINLPHDMPNNVDNNGQIATNGDGDDDYRNFDTLVEVDNDSPRKIPSNRDRHSKVNTARGPRDRRMRLSLDVAKRLFGLQDLLGFDKASKTVDWLLTESKAAILDLLPDRSCSFMDVFNNTSSTSECEVVSGSCDQFMVKTGDDEATTKNKAKSCSGSSKKQKDKTTRARKCAYFQHPLAKEIRARARQRARERTIQKQNNYSHGLGQDSTFRPFQDHQMDEDVNQLGSWSTFQGSQCQLINQVNDETSSNLQFNQGFVGDNSSLSATGSCTPSYLFDYDKNSGLTDEHQFNDLKIRERAWEG